jgi:hypothetical protein
VVVVVVVEEEEEEEKELSVSVPTRVVPSKYYTACLCVYYVGKYLGYLPT